MRKILRIIIVVILLAIPISLIIINSQIFIVITSIISWIFMITILLYNFGAFDDFIKRIRGYLLVLKSGNTRSKGVSIGSKTIVRNPQTIQFGNNVTIGKNVDFFPLTRFHGKNFSPQIIIGNNVQIGDYNRFACQDKIIIEDDVLFAAYVHITDHSHDYTDPTISIMGQDTLEKGPVVIGKGSWVGIRCSILSGVTVGEHCVIAAGSIVTHDVPAFSIVAGAPAKVIKKYDFNKSEWVNV